MREGQGQEPLGTQRLSGVRISGDWSTLYQATKVQGKGGYRSLPPKQKNAGDRNQSRSGKHHQPLLLGKQEVLAWVTCKGPGL